MLKKVVISSAGTSKAIAFFEDMKLKKEAAKKKIEARTEELKGLLKKRHRLPTLPLKVEN